MNKKQLKANIKELDLKIGKLNEYLGKVDIDDDEEYEKTVEKMKKLTELRCKLHESQISGSLAPTVVSGALSVASLVIVLKFEKTEIITSKAFNMATSMFRGNR